MTDQELPIEAEALTGDGSVTVSLAEQKVTILPRGKWRVSASESLRDGRFSAWAKAAMTPESYETWLDIDPTMDEVNAMFEEWAEATGQSRDLSRAQRRASQRSPKR